MIWYLVAMFTLAQASADSILHSQMHYIQSALQPTANMPPHSNMLEPTIHSILLQKQNKYGSKNNPKTNKNKTPHKTNKEKPTQVQKTNPKTNKNKINHKNNKKTSAISEPTLVDISLKNIKRAPKNTPQNQKNITTLKTNKERPTQAYKTNPKNNKK